LRIRESQEDRKSESPEEVAGYRLPVIVEKIEIVMI